MELKLNHLEFQVGTGHPSLDDVYAQIYEMNTPQPYIRGLANRLLKWLCMPTVTHEAGAQEFWETANITVKPSEMMLVANMVEIMSFDADGSKDPHVDEDFLLNICSNLVITKMDDNGRIRFALAHVSVLDFLRTILVFDNQGNQVVWPQSVHEQVATDCLHHMGLENRQESSLLGHDGIPGFSPRAVVIAFARAHWPIHFQASAKSQITDGITRAFDRFLSGSMQDKEAFKTWVQMYHSGRPKTDQKRGRLGDVFDTKGRPSKYFCAILIDAFEVIQQIPLQSLNELNSNGESALDFALAWGSSRVAKYLSKEGVTPVRQFKLVELPEAQANHSPFSFSASPFIAQR